MKLLSHTSSEHRHKVLCWLRILPNLLMSQDINSIKKIYPYWGSTMVVARKAKQTVPQLF